MENEWALYSGTLFWSLISVCVISRDIGGRGIAFLSQLGQFMYLNTLGHNDKPTTLKTSLYGSILRFDRGS